MLTVPNSETISCNHTLRSTILDFDNDLKSDSSNFIAIGLIPGVGGHDPNIFDVGWSWGRLVSIKYYRIL